MKNIIKNLVKLANIVIVVALIVFVAGESEDPTIWALQLIAVVAILLISLKMKGLINED